MCYLSDFVCEKVDGDKEACFDCRFIIAGVPREVVCNGIQPAGRVVKSHIAPTVIAACIGKKPFAAPVGGVDTVKIPVFGKTVNISVYICAAVHVRIVIERIFLNLFLGHGGGIVCREGNPGIGQRIVIVKHAIAVQTLRAFSGTELLCAAKTGTTVNAITAVSSRARNFLIAFMQLPP